METLRLAVKFKKLQSISIKAINVEFKHNDHATAKSSRESPRVSGGA